MKIVNESSYRAAHDDHQLDDLVEIADRQV